MILRLAIRIGRWVSLCLISSKANWWSSSCEEREQIQVPYDRGTGLCTVAAALVLEEAVFCLFATTKTELRENVGIVPSEIDSTCKHTAITIRTLKRSREAVCGTAFIPLHSRVLLQGDQVSTHQVSMENPIADITNGPPPHLEGHDTVAREIKALDLQRSKTVCEVRLPPKKSEGQHWHQEPVNSRKNPDLYRSIPGAERWTLRLIPKLLNEVCL